MSEAAFLGAICADPDDDTARLAFADWLDEHDRPARAEFTRAQVELARMDEADPRYPALLARSRRCGLFTDPALRFETERVAYGKVMFRRGFVHGLEIGAIELCSVRIGNLESLPLEQLRILCPDPSAGAGNVGAAVAKRPELAKLRTLSVASGWGLYDLGKLLESPHLTNLRALAVTEWHGGENGLRDLVPRLALPSLDSLALHLGAFSGNPEDDPDELDEEQQDDWNAFLPTTTSPLRRLHFDGSGDDNGDWTWPGATYDWLTASRHWPALEVADMRMGIDHISTGHYVAVAPPGDLFRRLKDSRLTRLMTNGTSLDRLLSVPDWGPVRALAVHGGFHGSAIARLLTSPQAQRLEWLTLAADYDERRPFRLDDLPALFREEGLLPNLKRLSLGNLPGEFLSASFCRRLLRLDVGTPGLYEPGLAPIVGADLPELRHLTMNGVRPESALEPLATATNMPNLCTVCFGSFGSFPQDWLDRLVGNRAMPRLSLLGTENGWGGWWVLGNGRATPVSPDVLPVDEDWWEPDPLLDWFW